MNLCAFPQSALLLSHDTQPPTTICSMWVWVIIKYNVFLCDCASQLGTRSGTFTDGETLDEFYKLQTWDGNTSCRLYFNSVIPL